MNGYLSLLKRNPNFRHADPDATLDVGSLVQPLRRGQVPC